MNTLTLTANFEQIEDSVRPSLEKLRGLFLECNAGQVPECIFEHLSDLLRRLPFFFRFDFVKDASGTATIADDGAVRIVGVFDAEAFRAAVSTLERELIGHFEFPVVESVATSTIGAAGIPVKTIPAATHPRRSA